MTDAPDDHLAPGCFGSALTYKETQVECQKCPFAARCKPLSEQRLERLRAKFGIKSPRAEKANKAQPERPKADIRGDGVLTALPKKVEELMGRIERAGIKIGESLREGRNPFIDKKKPEFLLVTCHLLLNLQPGMLTRALLSQALVRKLKWSEGTATAHAIQATQLLCAVGAAYEQDGRFFIKR